MDPRQISLVEQEMELMLSGFRNLVLAPPENPAVPAILPAPEIAGAPPILETSGMLDVAAALEEPRRLEQIIYQQQYTENIAITRTSEFNIIDVEVVAVELNYALEQMSYQYILLEEINLQFTLDYFKLVTVIFHKHQNNHVMSLEMMVQLWTSSSMVMTTDTRISALELLLKCTSCSVIIFTLYESFRPDQFNINRPIRMLGRQILNEAPFSGNRGLCINSQRHTRQVVPRNNEIRCIQPSPPMPSTSNFDGFEQPSSTEGKRTIPFRYKLSSKTKLTKRFHIIDETKKSVSLCTPAEDDQEMVPVESKEEIGAEGGGESNKNDKEQNDGEKRKKILRKTIKKKNQSNMKK